MLLETLRAQMETLDSAIKPLAHRKVSFPLDPSEHVSPLDELGIRQEAMSLLSQLADAYAHGDDQDRQAIRGLFKANEHFNWAAHPDRPAVTRGDIRLALLCFSMADQMPDPKDASMSLYFLKQDADAAGLDYVDTAKAVAEISSDSEPLRGWRSTHDVLMSLR